MEVQHRARDIMFSDKTLHNIQMSMAISYYLRLIDDLYKMLEEIDLVQRRKTKRISLKSFVLDIRKYQKNMEQKLKMSTI